MKRRGGTIEGVTAFLPGASFVGPGRAEVTGIGYDSRLVAPGELFAALRGADFDGHAFIPDAEARGAGALLAERPVASTLPQIIVSDSRTALAKVSAAFYDDPSHGLGAI